MSAAPKFRIDVDIHNLLMSFPATRLGWNGDGTGTNGDIATHVAGMPGFVQDDNGELHFAEWNCRAGQNNVIIRTDGTLLCVFRCIGPHLSGEILMSTSPSLVRSAR